MKKIIIILLMILVLLNGCETNDCYVGLFPSEADYAYCQEKAMYKLERCIGMGEHYWSNEEQTCKPIEEVKGCIELESFERIKVTELPINYENITDIRITRFCSWDLIPPKNISCEEWGKTCYEHRDFNCEEYGTDFMLSHYFIYARREPIELCWN